MNLCLYFIYLGCTGHFISGLSMCLLSERSENENTSNVKERFKDLFIELVIRSHRASKMMYSAAADSEHYYKILTFCVPKCLNFVGVGAMSAGVRRPLHAQLFEIGGFVITAVAVIIEVAVNYFDIMKDYLKEKSDTYINAASRWQNLMQKAQSYLIIIDDPQTSISDIDKKFLELVDERANITRNVIVPTKLYNDTKMEKTIEELVKMRTSVEDAKQKIKF